MLCFDKLTGEHNKRMDCHSKSPVALTHNPTCFLRENDIPTSPASRGFQ